MASEEISKEKVFTLITGASEGIGKALAEECARRGHHLILIALQNSQLVETAALLQHQYKVDVKTLELNLTAPDALQYLYDWCHQQQLKINVLINNAGIGNYSYFQDAKLSDYQNMIQLNIGAVVALTHMFIPKLRENQEAFILNVGSFASLMPIPYKSVYSASKSFVLMFSRTLQMELKEFQIHVSCLCPGPTSTKTMKERNENLNKSLRFFIQTPAQVASVAIDSLFQKQGVIIPGWTNRFFISLGNFLPFGIKSYILKKIFKEGAEEDEQVFTIQEPEKIAYTKKQRN